MKWMACGDDGHWCDFARLNLDTVNATGVYIIWHEGSPSRVVKVGQGKVAERLAAHKGDARITQFARFGTLRVTWAAVASHQIDGVERYLGEKLNPLVAERFPDVPPIRVTLPVLF